MKETQGVPPFINNSKYSLWLDWKPCRKLNYWKFLLLSEFGNVLLFLF